ncbi:GH11934 [Drosophila grimshawi]|uniref:GH11934 n=1 Tax=Drosophila grimshawi TaxID=7222 RepID=B4JL45_DROGR|nr:GH11934 [Drosophila grimshawi]
MEHYSQLVSEMETMENTTNAAPSSSSSSSSNSINASAQANAISEEHRRIWVGNLDSRITE